MSNNLKLVILVLVIVILAIGGYVYFKTDLLNGGQTTDQTSGDSDEISGLLNTLDQEQTEEGALIEANDANEAQSAVDDQLTNDLKQIDESVL